MEERENGHGDSKVITDLRLVSIAKQVEQLEYGVKKTPAEISALINQVATLRSELTARMLASDDPFKEEGLIESSILALDAALRITDLFFDDTAITPLKKVLQSEGLLELIREPELRDRKISDIIHLAGIPPFIIGFIPKEKIQFLEEQLNDVDDPEVIKELVAETIFDTLFKVQVDAGESDSGLNRVKQKYLIAIYNLRLYPEELFEQLQEIIVALKSEDVTARIKSLAAEIRIAISEFQAKPL